jgi:hypothetical protein
LEKAKRVMPPLATKTVRMKRARRAREASPPSHRLLAETNHPKVKSLVQVMHQPKVKSLVKVKHQPKVKVAVKLPHQPKAKEGQFVVAGGADEEGEEVAQAAACRVVEVAVVSDLEARSNRTFMASTTSTCRHGGSDMTARP